MSDGPHRSLPMRSCWKRVAERGDNCAFAPEEISKAIIPALEQDCREDIRAPFADELRTLCREEEASLFKEGIAPRLDGLRRVANSDLEQRILDFAIQGCASDVNPRDLDLTALTRALTDRAAKGARQVEEHYYRRSNAPRAQNVRARIERAIGDAATGIAGLARRILGRDSASPSTRQPLRQQGLDDGVKLR